MKNFFQYIVVLILMITGAEGQPAVTVDNLAVTASSGLTVTVQGDFQNQNGGTVDNAGTISVSGNWINNAANHVFSTNSGLVYLNGTMVQTIGGSNYTSFYNLTLNNSSGSSPSYIFSYDQTILNTLSLWAGNINLWGNSITLGYSASSPGALSHSAGWMYGGTFKRWFNTSNIDNGALEGLFPVGGLADYRPFYISYPSIAPLIGGTVSVSHINSAGTTAVSFLDINMTIDRIFNSYWSITSGNGLTGGIYNMRVEGTGFAGILDSSALRLTLAGSSLGLYGTNAGTNANPQVNRTGLLLTGLTNHFYIGYPSGAGPLPVKLLEFDATPDQSSVKIYWITTSEINSDYFTIERSADGETYTMISKVKAAGNSSGIKNYSVIDNDPLFGISFYRIKETDFDGSFIYSQPVTVRFDNIKSELAIVSTLSENGQRIVTVLSSGKEDFELELYDCIGKLISHTSGNLRQGYQGIVIPLETKATGISLITLKTPQRFITQKIF